MKININKINLLLLTTTILAPSANLTIKFMIDAVILIIFILMNKTKIRHYEILILLIFVGILANQDIQTGKIENILEISRLISVWITVNICKEIKDQKKIINLIAKLMVFAAIVTLLNYVALSDLLVNFGFNNISYEEAYGRNSSIFASFNAIGILSFLSVHLWARSINIDYKSIFILSSAIFCLVSSGSKTYILLTAIYLVIMLAGIFFIKLNIKNITIYLFFGSALFYLSDLGSKLSQFKVLYQFKKLALFLNGNVPTSILARFEHWENFWSLQSINFRYLLFGVPKEITDQVGNTFDSDFMFILTRFGIVILSLYLIYIWKMLLVLLRARQFSDLFFLLLVIIGSLSLGVVSDVQSLSLVVLFLFSAVIRRQ